MNKAHAKAPPARWQACNLHNTRSYEAKLQQNLLNHTNSPLPAPLPTLTKILTVPCLLHVSLRYVLAVFASNARGWPACMSWMSPSLTASSFWSNWTPAGMKGQPTTSQSVICKQSTTQSESAQGGHSRCGNTGTHCRAVAASCKGSPVLCAFKVAAGLFRAT